MTFRRDVGLLGEPDVGCGGDPLDLSGLTSIVGYPMVDTRAKFIRSSSFGDDIVIETKIAAFRNSSFDVEHRVFKPGGGEELAIEAFETRVWVGRHPDDPQRLKSRAIPEVVKRRLSGAEGAPRDV